jgi:ribosomal protein L1
MAEAKKSTKTKAVTTKKKQAKEAELVVEAVPISTATAPVEVKTETAKAGKRSAKAQKDTAEKVAKEARKEEVKLETATVKKSVKPPRSKVERAGKKYREAAKLKEKNKIYELNDALELAVKTSTVKFDATVELHVNLGVDPRQADQNVRGIVSLPEGTGKAIRVAVFAEADDEIKANSAGADLAGVDKISELLDKEELGYNVLIATPSTMSRLAKYAKFLGPKGLMPNPKSGTVTTDVTRAVKEAKAGKVEYRVDSAGIIHLGIGKVSFGVERLTKNAQVVADSIKAAKPASLKSVYVKSAYLSTTMGPSISANIL